MKYLVFIALISLGCEKKCYQWAVPPLKEDLLSCNQVRSGASDMYTAGVKFDQCMTSLGYYHVEVPCND